MTDPTRGSNEQALNEEFAQFSVDGQRLYGLLHRPTGDAPAQGWPSVVILHGFTGNRGGDHRLLPLLSRFLAARGVASLRFDFRGSGESHGDFSEMTVTREVQDTQAAFEYLRRQTGIDPERTMLLGFSMGGLVAALSPPLLRLRWWRGWPPLALRRDPHHGSSPSPAQRNSLQTGTGGAT